MNREELKPIELENNLGKDVNGVVHRVPWKAYDVEEVDNLLNAMEQRIKELEAEVIGYKASLERNNFKMCEKDARIAELKAENARLKAELKNEKYAHERIREVKDVLKAENARLKKQVPVWHTFSEKKPQLRQLILIKYEHKQEYPDKQMDAILWCPMREEELKLDMLTYKEWCEFPTTEESSATEKENG